MTVLSDRVPDLLATDAVAEHRWLTDHSWSRPTWTVAELEAAKKGRTVSVVPFANATTIVSPSTTSTTRTSGSAVRARPPSHHPSADAPSTETAAKEATTTARERAIPGD